MWTNPWLTLPKKEGVSIAIGLVTCQFFLRQQPSAICMFWGNNHRFGVQIPSGNLTWTLPNRMCSLKIVHFLGVHGIFHPKQHSLWGTPVTLGNLHIRCPPVASRLLIGHDFPNDLSADRRFIEGRPCRSQNHHAKKIGKIRYIYKYVYVCIYTLYIYICIYIFGESWSKNIIQDYFWWIFHLQQNYLHLFITSIGAGDFNPSPKSLGIIKEHSKPSTGTVFLDVF